MRPMRDLDLFARSTSTGEYIAGHEGVWLTTSDEIAEHYSRAATSASRAPASPTSGAPWPKQAMSTSSAAS